MNRWRVCPWVGGRMWCSVNSQCCAGCSIQPALHILFLLSPSICLLLTPFLLLSLLQHLFRHDYRSLTLRLLVSSEEEGGREEVRDLVSPSDTHSQGLSWGEPLLAAVWEELAVVVEEKNLAGRWATWLWFILHSWNVAGGLGKAFGASTESRDAHVQTSHSFYSKACLIGKILNLAFQDEENGPNCDFTAWVTHLISYWLHVGSLLLGWLWKIDFN